MNVVVARNVTHGVDYSSELVLDLAVHTVTCSVTLFFPLRRHLRFDLPSHLQVSSSP